jgi:hypothetical protein
MAVDYSKLSDEELDAIANDDYSRLSDRTLAALAATETDTKKTEPGMTEVAQMAAPVVTGVGYASPTGFGQLAQDIKGAQVMAPLVENVTSRVGSYIAKPAKAILDAGTMIATGIPGAAPAALYDTYKAVQESVPRMRQALGSIGDINPQAFTSLTDKMQPADVKALGDMVKKSGGKAALTNFQLPAYLAQDADAVATLNSLKSQAAAAPGTASRILKPLAQGALRVAGPVGMAANLYDAGQMARETELGTRLAQGQGGRAEQAFRSGMGMTYQGPQLDAQQAQNVLQSGSERDIKYFGGADSLREQMRKKAAARVTGPVAPGQF